MKLTYNWLKDFVDIRLTPEALADKLTMSGLEVKAIDAFEDDYVFEIEITSNRPDWLSVIGIAREVAAITGKKLKLDSRSWILDAGKIKRQVSGIQYPESSVQDLTVVVEDKKACPFYSARIIRNVKAGASPEWIVKRLQAIGLRSINNIVDITNYVLFTTGQPLHAFDLDKIVSGLAGERVNELAGERVSGLAMSIRKAVKGEKIVTIDGIERILNEEVLVIASAHPHTRTPAHPFTGTPIAIAGIMGGKDTEVTESTRNILLESAYFSPLAIRKASRLLGIASDSSYRFERSVDKSRILDSSNFAAGLMGKHAQAEAGGLYKAGAAKVKKKVITFACAAVSLLGQKVSPQKIKSILKSLDFKIVSEKKDSFKIETPDFRQDVASAVDLVEEVCRIAGYENVPLTLPAIKSSQVSQDNMLVIQAKIRETLTGLGFNEVITYSLLSEEAIKKTRFPLQNISRLANPLSIEQEILQPTLLSGLLTALRFNSELGNKNCAFFQIGGCFVQDAELRTLGLIAENGNLLDFKGKLELLLEALGIKGCVFFNMSKPFFKEGHSAALLVSGQEIGVIGRVKEEIVRDYKIGDLEVAALEINLNALKAFVNFQKAYKPLPKYPSVSRDISMVLGEGIPFQKVLETVKPQSVENLEAVKFKDIYRSEAIGKGKKSLTLTLEFRSDEKTLTDAEVNAYLERVIHKLSEGLEVSIR